jgi:hypothetical protein
MSEHEGIVDKLNGRQFLCVHHHLERFNALTCHGEAGALVGEAAHTPKHTVAIKAMATADRVVLRI